MGDILEALLVIDVQCGMFADPAMQPHEGEAMVGRMARAIAAARQAGTPVIFIQHAGGWGDPLDRKTSGFALRPEVAALPGETVLVKQHCSAFQGTHLDALLAERGIKRIAVCGMQTEYCIDTTCRSAYERGFEVTLISDAHTTFESDIIAAAAIIRHHNAILGGGFVTLQDTDSVQFGVEVPPPPCS